MLSAKPWNLEAFIHLLMGILFCVCLAVLAQGAIQHFAGKDKFADGSLLYLVMGSMSLHGSILLGTAVFLKWRRISWREAFGFSNKPVGRAILLGVLTCIIFLPAGMFLQEISIRILPWLHVPTPPQEAVSQLSKAVSPASRAYGVFFAVVFAPFAEEVFFRGILYTSIKQTGHPRFAIWGSAITFAAVHASAAVFLPLVVLSLAFIWLYEKTDNLLSTITAHALFNGINLVLMFYGDYVTQYFERGLPQVR